MIALTHTTEIRGKLADCFQGLASQLKKIVEAKLEVVQFLSAGVVFNSGLLFPLLLIVPFVSPKYRLWVFYLLVIYRMGFVLFACTRAAFHQYLEKPAGLNLRYEQLESRSRDL